MKVQPFLFPALITVIGIVLLFILESKIRGVLLIVLALAYGFFRYSQVKHPEESDSVAEKALLLNDRFHRTRRQNNH